MQHVGINIPCDKCLALNPMESRWEVKMISFFTVCVSTLQRYLEDAFILWRGEAIDVIVSISAQITQEFQETSSSTCACV
jgi:hypothetical protein